MVIDKTKDKKKKRPVATAKAKPIVESDSGVEKKKPLKKPVPKTKNGKTATVTSGSSARTDAKDVVVRKRMASLNASAMLAAAYEAERHIDRVESKYTATTTSATATSDVPSTPKRIKDIKNEARDEKEVGDAIQVKFQYRSVCHIFHYFHNRCSFQLFSFSDSGQTSVD